MEDSSRDLEKELKKYSVPNPFKRTGKWQLLFISEDGRLVSIRRYRELAMTVALFFCLSLAAAVVFSLLYVRTLDTNRELKAALTTSDTERKQLQEDKEHLQAQLFIPKKNLKTVPAAVKEQKKAEEPPAPPVKAADKKEEKMEVGINDLTFIKDEGDSEIRIRFIVKNISTLKSISGRVFVILKPDSDSPQDWLTMPPVALKDGIPSTPSRGQFFSINHFKSVNFKFNNHFADDHYKKMAVFVFSTEGTMVYDNAFDVDLDVIKKPVPPPSATKAEVKAEVPPAAVNENPVAAPDVSADPSATDDRTAVRSEEESHED